MIESNIYVTTISTHKFMFEMLGRCLLLKFRRHLVLNVDKTHQAETRIGPSKKPSLLVRSKGLVGSVRSQVMVVLATCTYKKCK